MKKIYFIIIIFLNILIFPIISDAKTSVQLKTDYSKINVGEQFDISVEITGDKVFAIDMDIYFDSNIIEYISGPENTNLVDGRIKLSWFDENAEGKTNFSLENFVFKQKQDGRTNISIKGNCYNEFGDLIETEFKNLQIEKIEDNIQSKIIAEQEVGTSTDTNNALLKILRTNQEEIIPKFEASINEYYLTTNTDINKLDITAIPENPNSKVEIIGNENFKQGKNIVEIKITSPNLQVVNSYKIFVTKTKDLEKSNVNLENLAIENTILYPSFDTTVTEYKIEIEPNIEKLNILAIPENSKATIDIKGNELLKTGDNEILISVLSEDKINTLVYKIVAHKRNEEEQQKYIEQEEKETIELENLLNEEIETKDVNNEINEEEKTQDNSKIKFMIIVLIIFIFISVLAIIIIKRKK